MPTPLAMWYRGRRPEVVLRYEMDKVEEDKQGLKYTKPEARLWKVFPIKHIKP